MAIVISSKNIYDKQNEKVINNNINKINVDVYNFGNKISVYQENINLDYNNITVDFAENTDYKNITFSTNTNWQDMGVTAYYVSFYKDFIIEDNFLLHNLTVKTENDNSPSGTYEERVTDIWQIYNPDNSGDIAFGIVANNTGFIWLEEENWGKVGLERLSTKSFRLYVKVLYYATLNNEVVAKAYSRQIVLYADEQTQIANEFSSGNNILSLNSNELMQNTTTVGADTVAKSLSDKILLDYANGKETAELLCSIGEYYTNDSTPQLAISTKQDISGVIKSTFAIGDLVIPYIFTPSGDVPMSKYKNNTPKQFYVIGTEIYFDGAVWQKLTLQEKTYSV